MPVQAAAGFKQLGGGLLFLGHGSGFVAHNGLDEFGALAFGVAVGEHIKTEGINTVAFKQRGEIGQGGAFLPHHKHRFALPREGRSNIHGGA